MKFWVVGKQGMLAQAFARELHKRNLSYFSTGKEEVDITNPLAIEKTLEEQKPSHVINCSAYTNVEAAELFPRQAFLINQNALAHLGEKTYFRGIFLIHFSTDYVFDGTKKSPYTEEDLSHPLNVYGLSKREGEKVLLSMNPSCLILRCAWLFGYHPNAFPFRMQQLFQKQQEVHVVENQIGSPTFCEDVVKTALSLLGKKGIFHVVNQGQASRFEWAKMLWELLPQKDLLRVKKISPLRANTFFSLAKRPAFSVLSTKKLYQESKITMRPWQEAMQEYIQKQGSFYESSLPP